ncbi:MAG TPA: amino acid ABC transporter permease [Microbacteriaceae bacterium]|nr:amino acid ABC transporter permease [Microbacteriaceae bacterium]
MTVDQAWRPSSIELARQAYRRHQTGRSLLIGAASTVAFATLAWFLLVNTPGWARVQESFFDLETWAGAWPRVWHGFLLNLQILVFAVVGVAIVASLLAFLRTLRGPVWFPLRFLAATYTDIFRGTPLIIVLYLVGFGVPGLVQQRIPTEVLGTVALVITYSAYVAEVLRAGLESVHPSQRMAARALGYTHGQTLRIVVLPQGIRKVTPALMNDFIAMQKDVGLVSILGAVDAVRAAQIETARFADFSPYVLAGLLFIALAWPMIRLTDWVTARMQRREQSGGTV